MVECPQCHSHNPPDALRCSKCDTALDLDLDGTTLGVAVTDVANATPTPTNEVRKVWSVPAQTLDTGNLSPSATALAPGTILGTRYEIIQLLGQGGMGAVYKATDRELKRFVALKVIRPELAARPEILERFKQELILARQVTHKNVIRIFDLGEADGIKYITMEYIEGQDLKSLVVEKGKLGYEETVRIIEQVCLALEAAHGEGVVHRDLKPQNIMLDKQGRVSVMDFGIARSTEMGGMTQTGALLGTPEYMSPEQVMGEHVDARSDLFTLGVILYQLLTGNMPYKADTVQGAMFKRTREKPRPPIEEDPSIPQFLNDVTVKCLQIDPALRYQSAAEIRQDLESWLGGSSKSVEITTAPRPLPASWKIWAAAGAVVVVLAAAGIVFRTRLFSGSSQTQVQAPAMSLAILPFRNASGDASLDWLGSSVAEMLSTDVGQSSRLRTVSPERVSQIMRDLRISPDTTLDAHTISRFAEFSNADTVVWGQYAKFGDQFRIDATVQDLKRNHTTTLKADAANEKEILSAVDRLAGDIRQNLALSSGAVKELQAQSFKPSSSSLPALRDYNEGLQLARQGNNLEAIKQFQASTTEDPQFALAYSQLAQAWANLGYDSQGEEDSRKALELSDKLPDQEKYIIFARRDEILKNYPRAIESYTNLAKVSPDNPDVLFELGRLQESTGAFDKARDNFSKVLKLDPKRVDGLLAMGRVDIEIGDAQSGLEFLNQAQSMAIELGNDEEKAQILQAIGVAYSVLNKPDDALRNFQESLEIKRRLGLKRGISDSLESIAQTEATVGKSDAALKDFNEALQLRRDIGDKSGTSDVLTDLAQFSDDRGQYDQALKYLKESLQIQRDVGNETNEGLALNSIGNTYLFKGDYENARAYLGQALQLREKLKMPNDIAATLHNLAETSVKMGQFDQATAQYLRALDIWQSVGDKHGAAIESASLGMLFGYQGRFGAALNSEDDSLQTLRDIHETGYWFAEILSDDGRALAEIGKSELASTVLDEAATQARDLKNAATMAQTLNDQGDNFFYQGDYKSAAPLYASALQVASYTTDRQLILLSKFNQAKLDVAQGGSASAAKTLRGLAAEADSLGAAYLSVECSIYLAEALTNAKSYLQAEQELQRAFNRADKLSLRALLAQSHYLIGRDFQLTGNAKEAASHFDEARRILADIQKESGGNTVAKRSDLSPIVAATTTQ